MVEVQRKTKESEMEHMKVKASRKIEREQEHEEGKEIREHTGSEEMTEGA